MKLLKSSFYRPVSMLIFIACIHLFLIIPASAQSNVAERHYISDILLVPLRTGPTIEYRIINAGLRSGTEVVLIESDPETLWSRIRVGEQEGWVPTRHLIDQPIARDQLTRLESELSDLRQQYAALQQKADDANQSEVTVSNDVSILVAERDEALREIERIVQLSGAEVALDRRNEELLSQNRTLQAEKEQLASVHASLMRDTDLWRMIIGGGLMLIGVIVGLIFPILARRRRSDGWN